MASKIYQLALEKWGPHLQGWVVEIGADRGEGSTPWIAQKCYDLGLEFHTVDVDRKVLDRLEPLSGISVSCMSGTQFLAHRVVFDEFWDQRKLCFAYLDNFDWLYPTADLGKTPEEHYAHQIKRYRELGLPELNNGNSQREHLKQAKLITVLDLADPCVIAFDDTWKTPSGWDGKGGLAVPFLLREGFEIAEIEDKGVALVRTS